MWTFQRLPQAGGGGVRLLNEPWRQAISWAETQELMIDMMRSTRKKTKTLHPHRAEHMSV